MAWRRAHVWKIHLHFALGAQKKTLESCKVIAWSVSFHSLSLKHFGPVDGKIRQRLFLSPSPAVYISLRLLRRFTARSRWLKGCNREIGPTLTQPRAQCCMECNPTDLKFMRIFRRLSQTEIENNSHCAGWGECSLLLMQTRCACTASREREMERFSTPSSRRPPPSPAQSGLADKLSSHSIWFIPGTWERCVQLARGRARKPNLFTPKSGLHFFLSRGF